MLQSQSVQQRQHADVFITLAALDPEFAVALALQQVPLLEELRCSGTAALAADAGHPFSDFALQAGEAVVERIELARDDAQQRLVFGAASAKCNFGAAVL